MLVAKIKIKRKRLAALYAFYCQLQETFRPQDEHQRLLFEHVVELTGVLNKMVLKGQEEPTLKLTSLQALAFCQLWSGHLVFDPYVGVTVNRIVSGIDQARQSPQARFIESNNQPLNN